jgi:hypothetical protein
MKEEMNLIADVLSDLPLDPQNDHGYTVGDELHEMNYYLKEIMEALQKIYTRMPIQE